MSKKAKSKKPIQRLSVRPNVLSSIGGGAGSHYTPDKNKKTNPDKLDLTKYDPYRGGGTTHREHK